MNTKITFKNFKLKEIATVIPGQSVKSIEINSKNLGSPFLQGMKEFGETYPQTSRFTEFAKKHAEKNDILMSVRAPVGPTNIADKKYAIGRGIAAIRPNENISRDYLLLNIKFLEYEITEEGRGTGSESITKDKLESINISIPVDTEGKISEEEQLKVVKSINFYFEAIKDLELQTNNVLNTIDLLKKSILSNGLNGTLENG